MLECILKLVRKQLPVVFWWQTSQVYSPLNEWADVLADIGRAESAATPIPKCPVMCADKVRRRTVAATAPHRVVCASPAPPASPDVRDAEQRQRQQVSLQLDFASERLLVALHVLLEQVDDRARTNGTRKKTAPHRESQQALANIDKACRHLWSLAAAAS